MKIDNKVLPHLSEMVWERTGKVTDVVNLGDVIDVKHFGLVPRTPRHDKGDRRNGGDRRNDNRDRKPRRD